MKKIDVSVIIPVYNAEKYIEKCIESVLNQTLENIEIILVNDGSTDCSQEILERYKKKFPNKVKLITQKNKGVMEARIEGYNHASGEYIAFLDNDDFVEDTMYEKLYKKAKTDNLDMVICNYHFYPKPIKEKQKWFNRYEGVIDWRFVNKNTLLWNRIIKKEYLEQINVVQLFRKMGEASFMLLLINTKSVDTIEEKLYYYRVGQQSLSLNFTNTKWHIQNIENAKQRRKFVQSTQLEEEWGEFLDYTVYYSIFKMLLISAKNGNKQEYQEYKEKIREYDEKNNKYVKKVLEKDFGKLKTFAILHIITKKYELTKFLMKMF